MTASAPASPRLGGIDLLRGLTVAVMILVNEWAGVAGLPAWMKHMPADADAMSSADIVFPAVLAIVGPSLPLALQAQPDRAGRHGAQTVLVLAGLPAAVLALLRLLLRPGLRLKL